jgi:hypothetical protein
VSASHAGLRAHEKAAAAVEEDLCTDLGTDAVDRLLAAGHDLKALTDSEVLTYLRWLYRKLGFDPRERYIILVDGPTGKGEWRREAFLTKAAIDVLRQRHRIRLTDVGSTDLQHAVVHTVMASAPGHRSTEVQGFAPRHLPDGTVDPYAYAKARAAARRTAVREIAAVSLSAFDDLDRGNVRVVDVASLRHADAGVSNPTVADSGLDAAQQAHATDRGVAVGPATRPAGPEDTAVGLRPQRRSITPRDDFHETSPAPVQEEAAAAVTEALAVRAGANHRPGIDRQSNHSGPAAGVPRIRELAVTNLPPDASLATPPRTRPWDPRAEFADTRAVGILRTLASRKLRTVHDELTFRHWLGRETQLPFAERDPADMSAAEVETLTRHLSTLPDLCAGNARRQEDAPPIESCDELERVIDEEALMAAAIAVASPDPTSEVEMER